VTRAIPAIPTTSQGVNFRSRLEARWAEMFTLLGWRWTYEPLDLDGYIPDFMLHLGTPVLVEVKPVVLRSEAFAVANDLQPHAEANAARGWAWMVVGCAPYEVLRWAWPSGSHAGSIGITCEVTERDGEAVSSSWDDAMVSACVECREEWQLSRFIALAGDDGTRSMIRDSIYGPRRRCGLQAQGDVADVSRLDGIWREAGNRVQWRGKRT